MSSPVVELGHAEGWDFAAGAAVGALRPQEARARDAAGLPYVVVYRSAGRSVPLEVRLVSWRDHYAGVWVYDEHGRRVEHLELRLLEEGRLLRRYHERWGYSGPEAPEFDRTADRMAVELFPGGRGRVSHRPRGDAGPRTVTVPGASEEERWLRRPDFDDWPLLSADRWGLDGTARPTAASLTEPVSAAAAEPWLPPRPGGPGDLPALFVPGTRLTTSDHRENMVVLEPTAGPRLRVPSGRLAVADPLDTGRPDITVEVPPGSYPTEVARIGFGYHCEFEGAWVERTETPALRLRVGDGPVDSWTMALGEGHDLRLLRDGEAYGFSTDGATGCFADAGAWPVLQERFRRALVDRDEEAGEDLDSDSGFFLRTVDEESGADLLAFATDSDGTHPVWLGLDGSGGVVCVIVQVDWLPHLKVV
ncbi:DUF4241 domain-containing protein [Kitasatospora sp. NPDC059827]|uniref:DUF4241 domain-containing protein n=1 Tax=Kitasatospora sp. NPDC059827 TaxID=3346964 RepID=UPI003661F028